jgi:Ni/Co efflux regulator RcnB
MMKSKLSLPLAMVLAAALSASPALAQKKGHDQHRDRDRQEVREGRRDRDDDDRWDDRRDRDRRDGRLTRRNVPPGWCQGRGNPHNTPENCGYRRNGTYNRNGTYDRNRTWDRSGTSSRNGSYGGYGGSYTEAHRAFHRDLDNWCRQEAERRGGGLRGLLAVRAQCDARHQEWHRSTGTRH